MKSLIISVIYVLYKGYILQHLSFIISGHYLG